MLNVGDPFPNFSLKNQDEETVTLADLKGKKAVLYFYPKDDTSGCTAEACGFRDGMPNFEGTGIYGISPDDAKSHRKFIEKYDLNFPLLVDEDHRLAEELGLWVEKTLYGKKYMGIDRTTYLLDEEGKIAQIWAKVKPEGHAEEVRAALDA